MSAADRFIAELGVLDRRRQRRIRRVRRLLAGAWLLAIVAPIALAAAGALL